MTNMTMIPHSRPTITKEDISAVSRVMNTGEIAQGEMVRRFEQSVASFVGVKGAVAVSSGTAALHLSLVALGVKAEDEVIMPSYLCVAPLNAVRYVGATAVFSDIDPMTGNIDPAAAKRLVSEKTSAIIVPHLFGQPARMQGFRDLGIPIIEDLAQSIGAGYLGRPVGNFGDMAICSFYATKVMTTGEGGMVLSNNEALLETVRDLRGYDEKYHYVTRFNYKMTDMQAALGMSQLRKLPGFISARRKIADFYDLALAGLPIRAPARMRDSEPAFFRYVLRVRGSVEDFLIRAGAANVVCRRPVYKPLHHLCELADPGNTDLVWNESVSIPIYPTLTDQERERVACCVRSNVVSEQCKS